MTPRKTSQDSAGVTVGFRLTPEQVEAVDQLALTWPRTGDEPPKRAEVLRQIVLGHLRLEGLLPEDSAVAAHPANRSRAHASVGCTHPINRRIGNHCALCGEKVNR